MRISLYITSLILLYTACGRPSHDSANLRQNVEIPMTEETRAHAFELRDHLWNFWNQNATDNSLSMSMFLSTIPMTASERQKIEKAYPNLLTVNCAEKPCTLSGKGAAVAAGTKLVSHGITNPDLVLSTSVKAHVGFNGKDSLVVCDLQGISVKKLFIEMPVLRIKSIFKGEGVSAVAEIINLSGPASCQ